MLSKSNSMTFFFELCCVGSSEASHAAITVHSTSVYATYRPAGVIAIEEEPARSRAVHTKQLES